MDEHELIVAVKQLAEELGRVPSCNEFRRVRNARGSIENSSFKTYTRLLEEAGLVESVGVVKSNNSIFEKDIRNHLESYEAPEKIVRSQEYPKILILGDTHFPFCHSDALAKAIDFAKEAKPDFVIQIGDLYDMYSHSKFPRSQNIFTPKEEEDKAREMAEDMWRKIVPHSGKCIQLLGNHDSRPLKRTLEAIPTMEHWIEKYFQELLSFTKVETIYDFREGYKISDITFIHGFLSGLGRHRDHFMGNLVCGHTHTAGVSYKQIDGKIIFEMNVGFLGDQYSKGLSYTPSKTVPWTLGHGYIDKWGPRFIPY